MIPARSEAQAADRDEIASDRHPLFAREGWGHIAASIVLAIGVHAFAGWGWALPFWLFAVFVVQFFRDPMPRANATVGAVVCPADGRVVAVGEVQDPYLNRRAIRVSVFMNVFNVHSNRTPVAGTVKQRWYNPGRFFNASLDKACLENERNALWIRTDAGQDVTVVQVAGLVARRILCYVDAGRAVLRGERYGFIRFGSRVDVYLPVGSTVQVALGDKVKAGRDVVALFA